MGYKPLIIILILATQSVAQNTFDPLSIGMGARALGMGRAAVAIAEEGDTIFTNPAGLGEIDSFKFSSMAGNLLEDVNYTVLGAVYPLGKQSAVGFGYVGSFTSGIEIRNTSGVLSRKADFGSSVAFASCGTKLGEKTSLGINLKYYFSDGTEINGGDGSGWNMDIGILQRGLSWLSLGLVGKNLLSSGKISYQNGESENLPQAVKAGARLYLLGSGFNSAVFCPLELVAAVDGEFNSQYPKSVMLHSGLELSPSPFLTLRIGLDQDNYTSGLSLKFAGLGFHYAYHPSAQYFSITFDERGWPPEEETPNIFLGCKNKFPVLE